MGVWVFGFWVVAPKTKIENRTELSRSIENLS
jgi:hypothetical protein